MTDDAIIWQPDPRRAGESNLARFAERLRASGEAVPSGTDLHAFRQLHAWSIANRERFWEEVWRDGALIAEERPGAPPWDRVAIGADRMAPPDPLLGPSWFPGARLNFAENLLRRDDDEAAIISWDERGRLATRSWRELRRDVARCAAALRRLGVRPGDRVAAWMPNLVQTVIAMLATTALGGVWTSCSPDFGNDGVVDRFGQTGPVILFYCDGYRYSGRTFRCDERAPALLERLPSVRHAIMIDNLGGSEIPSGARWHHWNDLQGDGEPPSIDFLRLPFDHPVYILYSSGTTGLPKCLVHSAGGTLLQHLKEHRLHVDLRRDERLFYFTTCGWMMWNWQVSALGSGATLVLYDGAPLPAAEPGILWRMAAEEGVNVFGTSAKYLALAEKAPLHPAREHRLSHLRAVLSTGSPLAAASFDWVHDAVGPQVQTASISGGTDIVSCFVLGNPWSPVRRGEIQGPGLGMAVDIYDHEGRPCPVGEAGELVCTRPFPAMPVAFWNDPDGARYRQAYFSDFPGVWRHGDWIAATEHGGYVISGRSDATLNPGGVRIGTAEIYRQVEALPEVLESLVVGQRVPDGVAGDVRVVLFVRLRDARPLTPELVETIRRVIREGTSRHHVPRVIVAVNDLPRTRSGKLSELAVRDVIEGRAVSNVHALANPEALDQFRDLPELR